MVTLSPLPELISNLHWLFSNPIDLKDLRKDIWAWGSVPHIKGVLHKLLAVLETHNVAATFFISGVCAKQNKDEICRIRDAGHEIGLHGYRHVPYDMSHAEMMNDLHQAISVFREIGVNVEGFRAPWLIANENAYRAAQMLNLKYVSNVKAKKTMQWFNEYDFVQLPIYLDDESLLQENAVEVLLESSESGRVFGFHLLYVRQTMYILEEFITRLEIDTATLSQISKGGKGLGLSFDIAYLSRLELLKKLVS
jgi:peptidoglycan/xylan/chitin deacetylase (PgdA/CDA1 family)